VNLHAKQTLMGTALAIALMMSMSIGVSAADYNFEGVKTAEYYPSTGYEDTYGARYQYGGINAVDYKNLELRYGVSDNTSIGVIEKVKILAQSISSGMISVDVSGGSVYATAGQEISAPTTAYTSVTSMERSDGSIGTVNIPSLGINMNVWEGETNVSMAKGLGHFSSTSGWNGNVCVCGHNRGAKYVIGSIKDLNLGDTITYATVYGTRTYKVSYVGAISNTDWSYFQPTADNRITLITCLANQPAYRVCVQAIEVR
jgi:LPXTG-site transpeptidase (sortase) family protein